MILGKASPWHPLDLPWDEAPGWDGIPGDREARPTLDEVLTVRRERRAVVRHVTESSATLDDQVAAVLPAIDSASADLDEETRRSLASAAIPVPDGVTKGVVRLVDERRFDVPVVLVCPEFTPAEAAEWIDAGDVPELAKAKHVDFVDIDSGHWPMVSQPIELARLLATTAARD